jgi:hypothetical protein
MEAGYLGPDDLVPGSAYVGEFFAQRRARGLKCRISPKVGPDVHGPLAAAGREGLGREFPRRPRALVELAGDHEPHRAFVAARR